MSEGNWEKLDYNKAAPNDQVVKYLGPENDGVTVAMGVLKQIAAFNGDQWDSVEAWDINSINADVLLEGKVEAVGQIVKPANRPQDRTEL